MVTQQTLIYKEVGGQRELGVLYENALLANRQALVRVNSSCPLTVSVKLFQSTLQ